MQVLQALVMTVATQICTGVVIYDIDDYTIAFQFRLDEGADAFIDAISVYEGRLSFSRLGLDVLVTFAED